MRKVAMLFALFVSLAATLSAQTPVNLLSNPGFEELAAGWSYWDSDDPGFVTCEIIDQNPSPHGGQYAAKITASQKPSHYACWSHGSISVPDDDSRPDIFSFWYYSPLTNGASCTIFFYDATNGMSYAGSDMLPASSIWVQYNMGLDVPLGTRSIRLELRACDQGTYAFDDIWLGKSEGMFPPIDVLFVGVRRNPAPGKLNLPALWQQFLPNAGYPAVRQKFVEWDNLTPGVLKTVRTVVLVEPPMRPLPTGRDTAIAAMLVEFVDNGGGLLLGQSWDQMLPEITLPAYLAHQFGAQVLLEPVMTNPANTTNIGSLAEQVSYTDQIPSSPWTTGVTGIWYLSLELMGELAHALPFLTNAPAWTVALKAGVGTYTTADYRTGLSYYDQYARTTGYSAGEVPLAGMRAFGAGRVGYIGLYTRQIFSRPQDETYETFMQGTVNDRPSNLMQFYVNAIGWLGSNADALASTNLTPLPPSVASQYTTDWKLMRGIIGPRTTCSSGSSSVGEYVAAATNAGLDYIVFLEDFAALKLNNADYIAAFEALRTNCVALSSSNFLAIPGITYRNDQGNHEFAFGAWLMLPSELLLDSTGTNFLTYSVMGGYPYSADMTWLYTLQAFWNVSGWYLFDQNPYPFYDSRAVSAIAVVTQQGGTILERHPEAHAYQARSQQYNWPLALNLMTSATQLKNLVETGGTYLNVIGAYGIAQLDHFLNTSHNFDYHSSSPGGAPPFGSMSLTRGPMIQLSTEGGIDPAGDPYCPDLQSWPMTLSVTSAVALSEVLLYDGERVIRRFQPNATTFAYSTSLGKERQKSIWVQATDVNGKEAICRDIDCYSTLLCEKQCGDRNNQLLTSLQLRPDGSPFSAGYPGSTAMPDKGGWYGYVRPVGNFISDPVLGIGGMGLYDGAVDSPRAWMEPLIVYNDNMPSGYGGWHYGLVSGVPQPEGAPHVKPQRVVASSDALVADRVLDGVFPTNCPSTWVISTRWPVTNSQYLSTTAREYHYRVKPDGISAYLWDQTFTVLKEIVVPASPTVPYSIGVGLFCAVTASNLLVVNNGVVTTNRSTVPAGGAAYTYAFNAGDYIGFLNSPFGSFVAYSLTDGLVLYGDNVNQEVGFAANGNIPANTTLHAKILLVGLNRLMNAPAADPLAFAAGIRTNYGIVGTPSYTVAVQRGSVLDRHYLLSLQAEAGRRLFQGNITGLAALPGNLGSTVAGLNDNWTAVWQVADGSGRVKTRLVPVEQGLGYAVWQAEDEGKTVTIGHPVTASDTNIVINLARSADYGTWNLEIHNPTTNDLYVTVSNNPAFAWFTINEQMNVSAGSSAQRSMGSAHVALTAPTNGMVYPAVPVTIGLAAVVAVPTGTISGVEFYRGNTLLGSDATAPYSYPWNCATAGVYALTARAYDTNGNSTTSGVVTITVNGRSNTIPWSDNFENYRHLEPLINGTNGWYGSTSNIMVVSNNAIAPAGSTNIAMLQAECTLSNRFAGSSFSNVWIKVDILAGMRNRTNAPVVDTSVAAMFYVNGDGNFVVHNGPATNPSPTNSLSWLTLTNGGIGTNGTNWVTVGVYEKYSVRTWDLYANGTLITSNIGFINTNLTNFAGFDVYNGAQTAYLDNVAVIYNDKPVVTLAAPTNGTAWLLPATIAWTATLANAFGTIMNVSLYTNGAFQATGRVAIANMLYTNTWINPAAGRYTLTAKAWDGYGAVGTSPANTIVVWTNQDIGNVVKAGSATYTNPTYQVKGAGADIEGTKDAFRYVYLQMPGSNYTLTARVATMSNPHLWAKAGLMIRKSLATNAVNALVAVTPATNNGVTWQSRASDGGGTTYANTKRITAPRWIKLVRSGNSFSAYQSVTNSGWAQIGTTITLTNMGTNAYVGLAVTSHNTNSLCTVTMDNVSITVSY